MPSDPTATDHPASSATGAPLRVLATVARQVMQSKDVMAILLGALESLAALARYEYALLELIPGAGYGGAPAIIRATPTSVETLSQSSVLVDETAYLFPLSAGGRDVGRLRVMAADGALTSAELDALQALAGYVGLAVKLADLEASARPQTDGDTAQRKPGAARSEPAAARRTRAGSLKAEMSQILSAQLGLTVLCDRVLERLISVVNVEAGALFTFDDREGELLRATQRGAPGPLPARMVVGVNASTMLGRAAASGTPQLTDNIFSLDLQSEEDKVLRTWGFHTLLCFPLTSGKRLAGGLQLMSRHTGAISDEALALLTALNDELALALQNAVTFDRLSTMTVTDALTGLHNRRFCEEFVRKHLMAAQRARRSCGFLLIDIDHVPDVNDRLGRGAGDALLRGVASVLLSSIRAADLAGRYGGTEFMVVLPSADLKTAISVAERIRANIRELPGAGGISGPVTVAIGVSSFPDCAADLSQLFNSADTALFAAKAEGPDRVVIAPERPEPAE